MFSLPLPSQSQSLPPRLLCSPVRTAALVLPKPTEKKAQTAARLFLCSGLLFFFLQFALVRLCIFCCRRRCCVCALQLYSTAQPRRRRSLCDVFVARVTAGRRVCPVRWLRHPKLSLALSLFLLLSVSFRCLPPLAAQPRPLPTCRLPITLTHTLLCSPRPLALTHPSPVSSRCTTTSRTTLSAGATSAPRCCGAWRAPATTALPRQRTSPRKRPSRKRCVAPRAASGETQSRCSRHSNAASMLALRRATR